MNTNHLFTASAALLAFVCATGCTAPIDSETADLDDEMAEDVAESEAPLVNGTTTTDFAPVVRITWTKSYSCGFLDLSTCTETSYCTATAIADDLLVTASHCVKDGTDVVSKIKVSTAHGVNASAEGVYSSYFIMSEDIYNNVDSESTNDYYYRDFAFIKFGPGTFSEYYDTTYMSTSAPSAWTVTKVGFGGDSTKEYATKTVATYSNHNGGDYRVLYTSRSGAYTESGDSGGPLLKWNSTSGDYEVLGVVFGHSSSYDYHPSFTTAMETNVLSPMRSALPAYCLDTYEDTSYGGSSWALCNYDALDSELSGFSDPFIAREHWSYGDWNDELSSLTLPTANTVITLYEDSGQGGSSVTFQNVFSFGNGASVSSLVNESFNDKISSYSMMSDATASSVDWNLEITRHGKCIDTTGTNTAGTNVYQWSCQSGNDNQIFRLEAVGNYYQIKHQSSGLCLGAENSGTSNGTKIELQTCDSSTKQLFTMSSNTSTSSVRDFKMVHAASSRCVDLSGGSSSNGTAIQLWQCDSTNTNQNFALKMM